MECEEEEEEEEITIGLAGEGSIRLVAYKRDWFVRLYGFRLSPASSLLNLISVILSISNSSPSIVAYEGKFRARVSPHIGHNDHCEHPNPGARSHQLCILL